MAPSKHPKRSKQLANLRPAPPPEKGNRRRVTHGARATPEPKRQAAIERQLAAALPVRGADGEAPAHDAIAVRLLAITLCRLETCARYVSKHGMFDKSGRVRPAADHEQRLIERAANLADRLGLTPKSRVALGLTLAQTADLAQALSDTDSSRRTGLLQRAGVIEDADVVDDDPPPLGDDDDE
jgi:hypothetical protein